jgi:hypothetical protein
LHSALVNLSLDTWHASVSYILGRVLRSFASSLLLYWCRNIFDTGINQLLKQTMIIWENHQNRRKFTVATGSCCLHRRGSHICNVISNKFLILKVIAAEQVNSRKLETCFGICSKKKSGAKLCWRHKDCHILPLLCLVG